MDEGPSFAELMRRVRAGDDAAAALLVRRYESAIRRTVRFRLVDTRLRRVCDSMDICQSILASFFFRAASGQYELDTPEQLLKLLAVMARNKVADEADKQRAARRDQRRTVGPPEEHAVATGASASRVVAARELLEEAHRRLAPEERQLVELRNQGLDWAAIALQLGGSPEALRKKLARAVDRVARQLDLDNFPAE
jgi:RNA polymerase sigma factor (sigma-70 family)